MTGQAVLAFLIRGAVSVGNWRELIFLNVSWIEMMRMPLDGEDDELGVGGSGWTGMGRYI